MNDSGRSGRSLHAALSQLVRSAECGTGFANKVEGMRSAGRSSLSTYQTFQFLFQLVSVKMDTTMKIILNLSHLKGSKEKQRQNVEKSQLSLGNRTQDPWL